MKTRDFIDTLIELYRVRQPTLAFANPGVGKSAIMRVVAKRLGINLIDFRAPYFDRVDIHGMPKIINDRLHHIKPVFLPNEGAGILFADEINAAPREVQTVLYELILDRRIGDYKLPDGWCFFGAGNRTEDGAITEELSSALATRVLQIDFEPCLDYWIENWALDTGIEAIIIAFLQFKPDLFNAFDPDSGSSPVPRTWEIADRIIKIQRPPHIRKELLTKTLGSAAATELETFLRVYENLPKLNEILMNPDTAPVPSMQRPDVMFATTQMIAKALTPTNIGRVITYLDRIPAEFATAVMRFATRRDRTLMDTRPYIEWSAKNKSLTH